MWIYPTLCLEQILGPFLFALHRGWAAGNSQRSTWMYSTFMSVSIPGAQAETFCPWLSEQTIKLWAGSHCLKSQWDTSELGQEPVLDLEWPRNEERQSIEHHFYPHDVRHLSVQADDPFSVLGHDFFFSLAEKFIQNIPSLKFWWRFPCFDIKQQHRKKILLNRFNLCLNVSMSFPKCPHSWCQNFSCDMRSIPLAGAAACQEWCLESSNGLTLFHRNHSPRILLLNCCSVLCLLTLAVSIWGLSALVPLNELISSTQEHFPFPSCTTLSCASQSKLVSSCPSISSPWADGRTVIVIKTLGNAEQGGGHWEYVEFVSSG